MYGTIYRMRPKPGREKELAELYEEFGRTRAPHVKGIKAGHLLKPGDRPGEFVGVAIFADKESYWANAKDPEQDKWYRRMRDLLEADPVWEDSDVLASGTGNPDARRVVEENFAAFNAHDLDRGAATIAPSATTRDVPTGNTVTGPNGFRQYWGMWLTAFPDGRCDITKCVATDDGTVVTEFVGRGTHNGPLPGPGGQQILATGRRVEMPFCQIATVKDGKITSGALYYDLATMLAQLGLGPHAASAEPTRAQAQVRKAS